MNQEAKVAIITGASQGIGAGLVQGYLEHGFRVVANSRSIPPASPETPNLITVAGDAAEPETAERVFHAALERFGRVDTLINNAGIFVPKPFVDYTLEDFNKILAVNLASFFHFSQRAVKQMLRQGSGHIVQISTFLTDQPLHVIPAALASLSKGGINAVTRSLAIEYADKGIRVNAVSLGAIKTPMHAPETHGFLASLHPVQRMGEVRDVVDAILYLESASFVTGEVLNVDGGLVAGR